MAVGPRPLLVFCLLLTACARRDLSLLDREILKYKAENERVRAEDLEARYLAAKERADALSDDLLALARRRDALFEEYDRLRAELARLRARDEAARAEAAALEASLRESEARETELRKKLAASREAAEALQRELVEAEARRRALDERAEGGGALPPQ